MMTEWARRGMWAAVATAWGLLVLDALPWGWDLGDGSGAQGLVRVVAVVGAAWLVVFRARKTPVEDIYAAGHEAGFSAGWEAGRRAAANQLRSQLEDSRRG